MKRAVLALFLALNLVAFSVGCADDDDNSNSGGNAEAGIPDAGTYKPPPLPTGQLWAMLESQMLTMRQTVAQIRENLLNKDIITVMHS